ncbi:MAG: ATP-binding cassette domain-containing protein [Chloroflexota bacterium]|nr:ATP-binding cassette domain-containing protein [Chloroflexota bacterium]
MDAIITENLTKTYGNGVKALDGVSFAVRPGEIFGLLGPNGAGKSTTVRILATLTFADGGTARVAGHDVRTESEAVRRRIGYVSQASGVDKYQTGRENLTLQGHLVRVPGRELRSRVDELLAWVGLTEAADRTVKTYSGGMKRRLDLAMGLIHKPAVLFLDEPTTGLDPETRATLWQDLQRLRAEQSLTVLLTTHYLEEADQLCDRLAIVDHGKVVVEGTPSALKSEIRGDAVTLEVDTETALVATTLRPLAGVLDVIPNGRSVVARVAQGATAIPTLITALEQQGVGVQSVSLSRPSLDDVYLHHTGHRFSAAADPAAASAPVPETGRGRESR